MANWYLQNGKDSDVVISSRVRLARNLADFPFKDKAKQEDLEQILKIIKEIVPSIGYGLKYIELRNIDNITKLTLIENHLISPEFATNKNGAILINDEENICIMINEEDEVKWRKELLTYYANNKFGGNFQKKRWREGGFTEAERELLYKSANYLKELKSRKNLTIIPLPKYRTDLAVKIIRKYKGLGVSYFILDTFKSDADDDSDVKWSRMADAMVKLYDTVKPVAKNVHLWVTLQLSKGSIQQRYFWIC